VLSFISTTQFFIQDKLHLLLIVTLYFCSFPFILGIAVQSSLGALQTDQELFETSIFSIEIGSLNKLSEEILG
jgi:hypothetical protein